ncbi:class I SAM-dependent methyltransferase [bacterium]|nr:class I SAM-dependent methyltransferase [bacterium]
MGDRTREPQYQRCVQLREAGRVDRLGLMSNQGWHDDPKRLLFTLARYKFVAKMLSGRKNVLEVGCADAFGTRVVVQEVQHVTATDFDPVFIADVQERMDEEWAFDCFVHDMLSGPVSGSFDAAYALDVIEHIAPAQEDLFLRNLLASLVPDSVVILGTPSRASEAYASPPSREGHVNLKDAPALRDLMERYLKHVFLFSMNDEVVHTGFYPMAHYYLALGCQVKERPNG